MTKSELRRLAKGYKVASVITNWLWELEKRVEKLEKSVERNSLWNITYQDGKKLKSFVWKGK